MKRMLFALALAPVLIGCNQKKIDDLETQVTELSGKNAEYEEAMILRDQQLNDYFSTMSEVEANLEEIKKQEGIITTSLSGEGSNQKDNIVSSINALNDLIQKNKQLVADLDKKYKNANFKIKELDKQIATLNEQIAAQENELNSLKQELAASNYKIETLTTDLNKVTASNTKLQEENAEKASTIAKQTEDLNTAYYIMGTYKELKEKNVLTKEGGFIGLGRNKELNDEFDASAFTKIDVRSFDELPLNVKNVTIVTDHLASSYELAGDKKTVESLKILDYNQFWKTSKYLVVVTE